MDHLRELRGPKKAKSRIFRRFETEPAEEAQVDWSPYRVMIGGREKIVHCFAMILCFSRYLFIQFHRDERLPTLLHAHVAGFQQFKGVTRMIVYDNMTTITFGRRGSEILWNQKFLDFAKHYMFVPRLCRIADPNRKGKIESVFKLVEQDFLRGREFASWDDLDRGASAWLAEIANRRRHGTTQKIPAEAWLMERDFLTALPETTYPTYREEIRPVYADGLISFDGNRYSVPAAIGFRSTVTVRSHPGYIDILNREGEVVATHKKPDMSGQLVINEAHYTGICRDKHENTGERERRFLIHFPGCEAFLKGLKKRMKSLYRLHLGKILDFSQLYGVRATAEALARVTKYGNFNAYAVGRILQDRFPLIALDMSQSHDIPPSTEQQIIEDVDSGDFEEYRQYSQGEDHDTTAEEKDKTDEQEK